MIVYRLEKDGYGIFCHGLDTGAQDSLYVHELCSVRRSSRSTIEDMQKWRYACDSIDKLIEYFGSDFAHILAHGGELVVYKVRKNYVQFSPKGIEVAFRIDKAERIN